ncbi:MAG: hypothetical protein MJ168_00685 [Clostridia bacterium]|nr:hypothetical protein [Clostridia bacterium]
MKHFRAVIALILVVSICFSFAGCSFRFSSFDSLLRPPRAVGKYQDLQEAFEKVVSKDYVLCSPENGEYKSAFLTFDCDSDGDEDAIVFYSLKSEPDLARLWYFKYEDEKWIPVSSVDGAGSSVNTVLFSDINLDGSYEIIVGWSLLSGKTNKSFVTYMISGEKIISLAPYPYNYICLLDANGDGREDIFTMSIDSSSAELVAGYARVYNYNANTLTLDVLSETRTDGNVSGYNSVTTEKVGDINYIYVEATKGETDSLTEVLYWDSRKNENKLVSPLFDSASQTTKATWRNINISCMDIDGDGLLEIPVSVTQNEILNNSDYIEQQDENTEIMSFIKWVKFRNNRLNDVQYSIVNHKLGYVLKIPSSWVERIIIKNTKGNIEAYRWLSGQNKTGDLLFSIVHYDRSQSENNYSNYKTIGVNGDTNYVYRITDAGNKFGVKDKMFEKDFIMKDFG